MSWQENVTGYFQILESHGLLLFYQQAGTKGSRKKAADNKQISPTPLLPTDENIPILMLKELI